MNPAWSAPLPGGEVADPAAAAVPPVAGDAAAVVPAVLAGRALLLVLLGAWSVRLIGYDLGEAEINQSFMHSILLPIHEAGHVFFMPFGEFLTILGGSLFQVALPAALGVAFRVKNGDRFAAAICLWWSAISVVDVAPYIYDSLNPQMILLGGHTGEDGPHDWIYLLGRWGQIGNAHGWGRAAHKLGALAAVASLTFATWQLWRQAGHWARDRHRRRITHSGE